MMRYEAKGKEFTAFIWVLSGSIIKPFFALEYPLIVFTS